MTSWLMLKPSSGGFDFRPVFLRPGRKPSERLDQGMSKSCQFVIHTRRNRCVWRSLHEPVARQAAQVSVSMRCDTPGTQRMMALNRIGPFDSMPTTMMVHLSAIRSSTAPSARQSASSWSELLFRGAATYFFILQRIEKYRLRTSAFLTNTRVPSCA